MQYSVGTVAAEARLSVGLASSAVVVAAATDFVHQLDVEAVGLMLGVSIVAVVA